MPPIPADADRVNNYDVLETAYSAQNETSIQRAYYERPAVLELVET